MRTVNVSAKRDFKISHLCYTTDVTYYEKPMGRDILRDRTGSGPARKGTSVFPQQLL